MYLGNSRNGGRIYRPVAYQMNLECLKRKFEFHSELYPLSCDKNNH